MECYMLGETPRRIATKAQQSICLHESSDSDDSDVMEYQVIVPSDRALRKHVPATNIQDKHQETTKEKSSAKRIKQEENPIEDFYQGYVECIF